MYYDPLTARKLLARTPDVLTAMLRDLPDAWCEAPEAPGAWSARDVVCHLADLESDNWIARARVILEHGEERAMPSIDAERFRGRYTGVPLDVLLGEFQTLRNANLEAFDGLELDAAKLQTVGLHPSFGKVTLVQLLSTWVAHDLSHIAQIARALAAPYRDDVGPWIQYLTILRRGPQERA